MPRLAFLGCYTTQRQIHNALRDIRDGMADDMYFYVGVRGENYSFGTILNPIESTRQRWFTPSINPEQQLFQFDTQPLEVTRARRRPSSWQLRVRDGGILRDFWSPMGSATLSDESLLISNLIVYQDAQSEQRQQPWEEVESHLQAGYWVPDGLPCFREEPRPVIEMTLAFTKDNHNTEHLRLRPFRGPHATMLSSSEFREHLEDWYKRTYFSSSSSRIKLSPKTGVFYRWGTAIGDSYIQDIVQDGPIIRVHIKMSVVPGDVVTCNIDTATRIC